jgi:hypothetical protein
MSGPAVFRRDEFVNASLDFGSTAIDLADYATTGLRIVCVGPSGIGKTNAGLLCAEQLAAQDWVAVLFDPEGEFEALEIGEVMRNEEKLENHLRGRHHPILVVRVRDTADFLHYGRVVLRLVDEARKPVFLLVDEGQVFSTSRRSKGLVGEASDLMNQFTERGRKRALDLFITAHRFSGTLHRSVFANRNLTLIGRQEDPTAWSALAPQFSGSEIAFSDLAALAPGEFFVFSRRGVDRVALPLAAALKRVAPPATTVKPTIPQTFAQWDRAMREIPTDRLRALTPPVVNLLGAIAGLTPVQLVAGGRALRDELGSRS